MDLVHIAQALREARQKQGLTVAQLAAKSGFSKGLISRLENFRLTPSLNALDRLCRALGLEPSALFAQAAPGPAYVFGDLHGGEAIDRDQGSRYGYSYFALAYRQLNRTLNPFLVEYRPSRKRREFMRHEADEFFLLLEGEVIFRVCEDGNQRTLQAGQTAYLSGNVPHAVELAPDCALARALVVYANAPAPQPEAEETPARLVRKTAAKTAEKRKKSRF